MKIRSGFVSNSSSSSFLIYGAWASDDEVKEALRNNLPEDELKEFEELLEAGQVSMGEWAESLHMYYRRDYECGESAFGRSWADVGDDETGRQFKESIEQELEKLFGKKVSCGTIKHTYYS